MPNKDATVKFLKEYWQLIVVLVFAAGFRCIYAFDFIHSPIYPVFPFTDGYYYFLWAKDISAGEFIKNTVFLKWPLYAYILSFFVKFCAYPLLSLYLFQFFTGIVNCGLIYFICLKMFNKTVGLIASALCVLYVPFMFYEGLSTYTSLSIVFNSALLLACLHLKDNITPKRLFILGIFIGLSAALQGTSLIFGILILIWMLTKPLFKNFKRTLGCMLAFFLGIMVVLGTTTLMNYMAEKDFVPLTGNLGFNFYSGNNPKSKGTTTYDPDISLNQEDMLRDARIVAEQASNRRLKTSEVSSFWFNKSLDFIGDNPYKYLRLLIKKAGLLLSPYDIKPETEYSYAMESIRILKAFNWALYFIMPLAVFGALVSLRDFRKIMPVYIMVFSLMLSMVVFFVIAKLRVLIAPFLCVFAASGIYQIFDGLKKEQYSRAIMSGILLLVLFIFVDQQSISGRSADTIEPYENYLSQAVALENKKDFAEEIFVLNKAISIDPNNRRAHFRLALAYSALGNLLEAERKFKQVLNISPTSVDAYYNLGLIYNKQGRFKEAMQFLEKAVSLDPSEARIHFELGICYESMGKIEDAKREYDLALNTIARWRISERAEILRRISKLLNSLRERK